MRGIGAEGLAKLWEIIKATFARKSELPTKVSDLSNDSNYATTSAMNTALNKKANDFSIEIYNGNGGVLAIKMASVNYSTCNSENGVAAKISMVSGHGNGSSYAFLQDVIIKVSHTGEVSVDNYKYYESQPPQTYHHDYLNNMYGDI